MVLLFIILIIIAILFGNYQKSYLNPFTIYTIVLSLQVVVYYIFFYLGYYNIEPINTCGCYLKSIIFFDISYLLNLFIIRIFCKPYSGVCKIYYPKNSFIFNMMAIISIFWLVLASIKSSGTYSDNIFLNMRLTAQREGHSYFGIAPHLILCYQIYVFFVILISEKIKYNTIFAYLITSLVLVISRMEKLVLLQTFTSLFFLINYKKLVFSYKSNKKNLAIGVAVIFILIFIFPLLRERTSLIFCIEQFVICFTKELEAFETCIYGKVTDGDFTIIFGPFLHYIFPSFATVNQKVESLGFFNVYSCIRGMYFADNVWGIPVVSSLLGIIYSYLYFFYRKGSFVFAIFYCFYSYPLIMSFFDYMFSYNNYIYYFVFIVLITLYSKKRYVLVG